MVSYDIFILYILVYISLTDVFILFIVIFRQLNLISTTFMFGTSLQTISLLQVKGEMVDMVI